MFLSYYGLEDQPFGVTPDTRYLYMSPSHREALASLFYGIQSGRGFLALIAAPGMGKTTLLFQLMEQLRDSTRTAFLFQTQTGAAEFLANVIADLGLSPVGSDLNKLQSQLNEVLLREAQMGRQFVLIIDEAQDLRDDVLEMVRMLSNFESPDNKLIQIVLAGQPPLAEKLASSALTQLRQRVSLIGRLDPLSPEEGVRYIDNRLRLAGYRGPGPLFTQDALRMLLDRSEGIPRNINNICFHALSLGCVKRQKTIDASTIAEVLADLDVDVLKGTSRPAERLESVPGNTLASPPQTSGAPPPPPSYQSANPWYRGDQSSLPGNRPLVQRRTHGLAWACVVLALVAGSGFLWERAGGNSSNLARALYSYKDELLSARNDRGVSTGLAGNSESQTSGMASSPETRNGSPQRPGVLAAASATPASAAPGPAQPGHATVAKHGSANTALSTSPGGALPLNTQAYDASPSASATGPEPVPGNIVSAAKPPGQGGSNPIPVPNSRSAVSPGYGELVMEANVRKARVFINGKSEPEWVTPHTFSLAPGTYWIEVAKYGRTSWYDSLHVSTGETSWAVANLGQASGAILIETDPSRIPVFIDGEAYGPSPVESTLSVGQHTYKVIPKDGAQPYTGSFVLAPTDILRIRVKWPPSRQPGAEATSGQSEVEGVGRPAKGGQP